jgi:acetyl esterase/lipase
MIRLAFLALAAISTPVIAEPPAPKLLTWPDLVKRPKPSPDATIAYGPDQMQKVDVWRPKGKGPFPVVVMVHGGCWTTSIADRGLMNWVADDLRKDGIAVWNIDYRGVDRAGGGYPGTFEDAAKATDALSANAATFNFDTRRIVAIGHSAGGHLALWLAARAKLPAASPLHSSAPLRIDHVISLGGLPDLEATAATPANGCGTEVVAKLVGMPSAARADVYADTSVPRLLPLGIAQDLVNGREDRIIPFPFATDYVAKAKAAGDTALLHTVPATGHVELVAPETPAWAEAKRLIAAALK